MIFPPVVDKVLYTYPGQKKKQDDNATPTQTICVPYVPGFSERFRKVMKRNGVRVVFKKGRTLGSLLVRTKACTPIEKSKDHIYLKSAQHANRYTLEKLDNTRKKETRDTGQTSNKERNQTVSLCTSTKTIITKSTGIVQRFLAKKKITTDE